MLRYLDCKHFINHQDASISEIICLYELLMWNVQYIFRTPLYSRLITKHWESLLTTITLVKTIYVLWLILGESNTSIYSLLRLVFSAHLIRSTCHFFMLKIMRTTSTMVVLFLYYNLTIDVVKPGLVWLVQLENWESATAWVTPKSQKLWLVRNFLTN